MSRVLIVGAGLTGSVCACLLRRELQNRVQIVIWDKARGSGESLRTQVVPILADCSETLASERVSLHEFLQRWVDFHRHVCL